MKTIYRFLSLALAVSLVALSTTACSDSDGEDEGETPELNTAELVLCQYEMASLLEKEDDPNSGYSAESFAALKSAKAVVDDVLEKVKSGEIKNQQEIDDAVTAAQAAIKAFRDSYDYTPGRCELYVPGAVDIGNYIKLGAEGDFDEYTTISVDFWFKGDETMNMRRQGSIISNFVDDGGVYSGWEVNTWADDEDGNGPYRLRITRHFKENGQDGGGSTLSEPSMEFESHTGWNHIAYTYDQSTGITTLYLNGKKETVNVSNDFPNPYPTLPTRQVQMCAFKSLTNPEIPKAVSGYMKNLRIWDKALTEEEVAFNRQNDVDGTEEGLIAAWDFTETVPDPENILDKTGRYIAQVLGDGVRWILLD